MADAKNAWRKQSETQREAFLTWIASGEDAPVTDAAKRIVHRVTSDLMRAVSGS
jgi:hypothetical protein